MFLEKQLQKGEVSVSGLEDQLVKDGVLMDKPNVLPSRQNQLQVRAETHLSHRLRAFNVCF